MTSFFNSFLFVFILLLFLLLIILGPLIFCGINSFKSLGYGYINNKELFDKNVPFFKGIPCNKDIFYASTLMILNKFVYDESNVLSAIIFKWLKDEVIKIKTKAGDSFRVDTTIIDLTLNSTFDNEIEKELFDMMYEASDNGCLTVFRFEIWCEKNYTMFLKLFSKIENKYVSEFRENGMIYDRKYRSECKFDNVMVDKIYDESVKLYGLKKYLQDFSSQDIRELTNISMLDEYLMFAYLFGIADDLLNQFKNIYPDYVYQIGDKTIDYNYLLFINSFSTESVKMAKETRNRMRFQ